MKLELSKEKLNRIVSIVEKYAKVHSIYPLVYHNLEDLEPGIDYEKIHYLVYGAIFTLFFDEIPNSEPSCDLEDEIDNIFFEVLKELYERGIVVDKSRKDIAKQYPG